MLRFGKFKFSGPPEAEEVGLPLLRFTHHPILRRGASRYALAIFAGLSALFLRQLLAPLLGVGNPYHTVWLGVVFCAWFCGVGPSIVATLIMTLGVLYWFIPPTGSFGLESPREFFGVAGFLFFAALIILIGERARRTQVELNAAHDEMEAAVKQRTAELADANHKLRELTSSLLQLQDAERRRFARDLHDSIGQFLSVIGMNLGSLSRESLSSGSAVLIRDTRELLDQVLTQVRTLSHLLHPQLLDEAGLGIALRPFVEGFAERSKVATVLDIPSDLPRFPPDVEISIFRIVQECLTNIHKHAQASNVGIRVGHSRHSVTLAISDDGKGLRDNHVPGVGLIGMHERVRQLGGDFNVASSPGGTTVTVVLPIKAPEPAQSAAT